MNSKLLEGAKASFVIDGKVVAVTGPITVTVEQPLKLQANQKYVREDGRVILIKAYDKNPEYPFIDIVNNNLYHADGSHEDEECSIVGQYVPKLGR